LAILVVMAAALLLPISAARAGTVPPGFTESVAFSGLTEPTSIAFSPDGRVFVAEKSGIIKVFSSLSDTTPDTFADLSKDVYNFWDRGLLGMALDPDFPAQPYVYVLYTLDAEPNGAVPKWGGTSEGDPCPTPPGPTDDGCVVTGRLSRLTATGNSGGSKKDLITDWCQQFPSHSIGDLAFDSHGALYVSGGEGANFLSADWGEFGNPVNPCGDPPGGLGASLTPPNAEGGSLRSQDVRTLGNPKDPTGLSGALLRIDPDTGKGWAGNPFAGSGDANAERILAYGFRNPFRIAVDPTNQQVWLGDVGQSGWEEIDHVDPLGSGPRNFGWPCYEGDNEGSARQGSWDAANLKLCESLYAGGASAVAAPTFSYDHGSPLVPGEACDTNGASTSGMTFYEEGPFPAAYDGALFFADYTRDCIWSMKRSITTGQPDPATITTFDLGAASPVNVKVGPDGALYFADLNNGRISKITYTVGNRPPAAVAKATPSNGPAPLQVQLSASDSSDPDAGDTLSYAWDLDEDGQFDDSTAVSPTHTFSTSGPHVASVEVTDNHGATGTAAVTIQVGNSAPVATIDSPTSALTWAVGDEISFSASATDAQETLPPSAYAWTIVIHHCAAESPEDCHTHTVETVAGQTGTFVAPDHEYPSYLEFRLKVTDAGGLSDTESVRVDPKTVSLSIQTLPQDGFQISVGDETKPAPFSVQVIQGSDQLVSAPGQDLAGTSYDFGAWSDGGDASHNVTVDEDLDLTATFLPPAAPRDSTPPTKPLIGAPSPASPANNNTPTLRGISESDTTVQLYPVGDCSGPAVANVPAAQFAIGVQLTVADDSSTTFAATATDAAGNTSACSPTSPYVEDSTAPQTEISRAPRARLDAPRKRVRGRVGVVRVGFSFKSDDGSAHFICKIDSAAPAPCSSPVTRIKFTPGTHRFSVRAVDAAGNFDATPAARKVIVREAPKPPPGR
jgi:glucose/arabinose dehydrogenase